MVKRELNYVLSGPRRANVVTLFNKLGGGPPDFHQALVKAAAKGFLRSDGLIMSDHTGLPHSRTDIASNLRCTTSYKSSVETRTPLVLLMTITIQ